MAYNLEKRGEELLKVGFTKISKTIFINHETERICIHKYNVVDTNKQEHETLTMTKSTFKKLSQYKDYTITLCVESQHTITDMITKIYVYEINDITKKNVKTYKTNEETGRKVEYMIRYVFNTVRYSQKIIPGVLSKMRKSRKKSTKISPVTKKTEVKVS